MAREVRDRAAAVGFLRRAGLDREAVQAAERLLDDEPGAILLESGWRRLEGVLVLGPGAAPDGERLAVVVAANERALRDLLLALPRGGRLGVWVGLDWHGGAVSELIDGGPVPGRDGCFAGVRRGAGAKGGGPADALLGRRDPVVELLRDLAQPAGRERHGRFVAEGPTLVRRAIDGGLPVDCLAYRTDLRAAAGGPGVLDAARAAGIGCWRASDGLMGTLTPTRPLPDVLAAVHLRLRDASELGPDRAATVLVAEHVQNPDNLGMVLRTADAAGVDAVVVAGEATDPLHRNCVRAARGAVGRIPILRCAALPAWIAAQRERGMRVVGATAHGDAELFEADLTPPIAIVVGNEEVGISREALAACTARVAIPTAPGQDSLNVGVAAGVLLFELARRRRRMTS